MGFSLILNMGEGEYEHTYRFIEIGYIDRYRYIESYIKLTIKFHTYHINFIPCYSKAHNC